MEQDGTKLCPKCSNRMGIKCCECSECGYDYFAENTPWSFCETPEEKCTMNYCDDNGCQNRKRVLVNTITTDL